MWNCVASLGLGLDSFFASVALASIAGPRLPLLRTALLFGAADMLCTMAARAGSFAIALSALCIGVLALGAIRRPSWRFVVLPALLGIDNLCAPHAVIDAWTAACASFAMSAGGIAVSLAAMNYVPEGRRRTAGLTLAAASALALACV
jgi:hypothetical protein